MTILITNNFYCQIIADTVKKKAIDCSDLSIPNDRLYSFLKDFKCICIGEMHGTKEPAEFLTYLVKLFIDKKKKVIVGIEIPKTGMTSFIEKPDSIGLKNTTFFSNKAYDGRASEAWFKAINDCNNLKASFCFLDGYPDNIKYDKVMECVKTDTNYVLITLTGNIHNMLLPWKENKTLGCYLKEFFGNKTLSINHIYNEGSMYNLTSEGLKVQNIPPYNSTYSTATEYSKYFIPLKPNQVYSAYYFTKIVTASFSFKK